ncbi:MAG: hypothetical protein AAB686_03775 [Patescibacteria group bacterium]
MKSIKQITITLLISIVLLGGIFLLARSGNTDNPAPVPSGGIQASLKVAEPYYDFGSISMASGEVSRKFSLKNDSVEPITIRKVYT